jgi:serine/threonine-protein kinase
VWALGCILYEMLAGEPPYTGSTPQAVLGKIITAEPASVVEARKSVPPNAEAAIRKALEKVPADRFATAGAFAQALGDRGFRHGGETALAAGGSVTTWRRLATTFAALAAVLAAVAGWALGRGETETVPSRVTLTLTPPQGVDINQVWGLTLSPDGRTVVYFDQNSRRLFRRDLSEPTSVPIAGTESSWRPFFSPDGAWVGFFDDTNNLLKRVRIDGTGAQTLADAPATGRSGVWREDGTIVFMSRGLGGQPARWVIRPSPSGSTSSRGARSRWGSRGSTTCTSSP